MDFREPPSRGARNLISHTGVREWRAATDDEFAGKGKPRVARRAAAPPPTLRRDRCARRLATRRRGRLFHTDRARARLRRGRDRPPLRRRRQPRGAEALPRGGPPPGGRRHSRNRRRGGTADLAGRVGPAAAAAIAAALRPAPSAPRMAPTSAAWPSGAPRPTPVARARPARARVAAAREGLARGGVVVAILG